MNSPCDYCRLSKRRCDGPERPDRICTRCTTATKECTYSDKRYIEALEARLFATEHLLRQRVPEALLMQELGKLTMNSLPSVDFQTTEQSFSSTHETNFIEELASISAPERCIRAFGQVGSTSAQDYMYPGIVDDHQNGRRTRRAEFWRVPTYEFRGERLVDRHFRPKLPPPEKLALFVRRYFETSNVVRPMFHRGLFEQHLLNPVVMRDRRFVAAVLLVCALGAGQIAVDDLQRGEGFNPTELAPKPEPAGWEFFVQAEPFLRMPTPEQPQLLDVQIFYLAAQYFGIVLGSFTTWVLLGTAAQLAFQANAHRLGAYKQQPNLTDELWKRTFWSLVMTDRLLASLHGRPLFIKDHTFDLDLPLEVDDDRWDLSTPGFPLLGPPTRDLCSSTFLIWHIRLSMISGFITQTLHSTNRSRLLLGFVGPDWEHHTMKHLDSLLSEWAANFPPELRWDPETPNLEIFTHSSLLCALYYSFVITAHNPFVRTTARNFSRANLHNTTGLDLTVSLAKCTEAALKCIDILLAVLDRHPWCLGQVGWSEPPFTSCLVLLVNLFGFKSSLTEAGIARFTRAIRICLDALNIISIRIKLAARFGDLLNQLVEELDHEIPMVSYSTPSPKHTDTSVASALRSEPPAAPISRPPTTPLSKDSTPERANSSFDMDELPLGLREQMVNGLRKVSPPSQLN